MLLLIQVFTAVVVVLPPLESYPNKLYPLFNLVSVLTFDARFASMELKNNFLLAALLVA